MLSTMPGICPCSRPSPGAAICKACTAELGRTLATAAAIWPDVEAAVSRQTRMGEHALVTRGLVSVLPWDDCASAAGRHLASVLGRWATAVATPEAPAPDHPAAAALWLGKRTAAIRQREDAPECAAQIGSAVASVMRAIDLPPPRTYAGPCGTCSEPLYVRPGAVVVTCSRHDPVWTSSVAERQAWMLGHAAGVLVHAAGVSHLLGLLGQRTSQAKITRLVQAGRLVPRGRDRRGRETYRIGDVLELVGTPAGKAS